MQFYMNNIDQAFTCDDVLMVPRQSTIKTRDDIDLSTNVGPLHLSIPIISANMDTITGPKMFNVMKEAGGWGWLHRFEEEDVRLQWALNGLPITIGVGLKELEFAKECIDHDCNHICIDIAHGDSIYLIDTVKEIRNWSPSIIICAGNICTPSGALRLIDAGADIIKCGVLPGAVCSTRSVTGHGFPQLSAIDEISETFRRRSLSGIGLIADGGIRTSGDIVKYLAVGADAVMIGRLFAGTEETQAPIVLRNGSGLFKEYRGMASERASNSRPGKFSSRTPEGISTYIPYQGSVLTILENLLGGIRSGFSYSGANNIEELRNNATFVRVSSLSLIESNI